MKFLADVNIPQSVIVKLEHSNHDVLDVKKVDLLASDTKLIRLAKQEKKNYFNPR